ncbi:hypothetical protein ACHAWF_018170 [Thalassiosira exigua]
MIMNPRSATTFEFNDDSPTGTPTRTGRRHRRGRGYGLPGRKGGNNAASATGRSTAGTSPQTGGRQAVSPGRHRGQASNGSYRQGGHNLSPGAASAVGGGSGGPGLDAQRQGSGRPQAQAHYTTSDAWDTTPKGGSQRTGSGSSGHKDGNDNDQNSCTGSLTYSASSSVQSAESSNDSSFADIIKIIDSENPAEKGGPLGEFISKQTKAASDPGGQYAPGVEGGGSGRGDGAKSPAVQGWNKRAEDRKARERKAQLAMQQAQGRAGAGGGGGGSASKKQQKKQQKQLKKQQQLQQQQQHQFAMVEDRPSAAKDNVDLNYSKDDSSEDDVIGVDVDENILETIAGLDGAEEVARHANVGSISPTQSRAAQGNAHQRTSSNALQRTYNHHLRTGQDAFATPSSSPYSSPTGSPSSPGDPPAMEYQGRSPQQRSPRSPPNAGEITPPPKSRGQRRTSTPPGSGAHHLSRTNSRHSKSSSDGSWDTPNPSSPPHGGPPSGLHKSALLGQGGGGGSSGRGSSNKPPHARSAPPGSRGTRRIEGPRGPRGAEGRGDDRGGEVTENALSQVLYKNQWMCGFMDAFNIGE